MTGPKILTGEGALGLLRLVVFEKGEGYVYPNSVNRVEGCRNFEDGQPSCIVGHVFAKLGVTYDDAVNASIDGTKGVRWSTNCLEKSGFEWSFSRNAIKVLSSAQSWQDRGATWGEALAAAEKSLTSDLPVLHPADN